MPRFRQDADLSDLISYNLKRAYIHMHEGLHRILRSFSLTQRTFSALSIVVDNAEISQSELSRVLGINRSGIVAVADELQGLGLIERRRIADDRRAYALVATPAGEERHAEAKAAVEQSEERLLSQISVAERGQLRHLLMRICDKIN